MAGFSVEQKPNRVVTLMLGFQDPRIASAMAAYGFTEADAEDGVNLLRDVVRPQLGRLPSPAAGPEIIEQADKFENKWFPIATATLRRHYPELCDFVFLNLSQTSGPQVIVSVDTFLHRLDELRDKKNGPEALKLLAKRGLNPAVMDKARSIIQQVGDVPQAPPDDSEAWAKAHEEAVDKLWQWYLEWGTIAQTAVTSRRLLKKLGYLQSAGPGDEGEAGSEAPGIE